MAEKMLEKTDEVQQEWGAPECVNGEVDFLTLSYDVGVQKPDRGIFEAAEKMALQYVGEDEEAVENGEQRWQGRRVHVGDEWKKDVEAARNAGWEGVLWRDDITEEEILEKILGPEEDI